MSARMSQSDAANAVSALRRMLEQQADPSDAARGVVDRVSAHLRDQIRRLDAGGGDGGPAAPCLIPTGGDHRNDEQAPVVRWPGMSLRDHFAGLAMQAAATNPTGADGFDFDQRATWAYQQADAMLKARQA